MKKFILVIAFLIFGSTVHANNYWLEAETADSITSPMQVANDSAASGGQFIWVPGQGNNWDGTGGYAEYTVNVATQGEYVLWGRVIAPTSSDDSFFVEVGGSAYNAWGVAKGSSWQWDLVNIKGGADPVKYYLTTGINTIKIGQREDGTKLDKLLLTDDMAFIPSGMGGDSGGGDGTFTGNNMQPYNTVNFIIALVGVFPSRNQSDPFIAEIVMFGGNFAPRGWALCDGQLLPIAQNTSAIFASRDNIWRRRQDDFWTLPDLRGRVPMHRGQLDQALHHDSWVVRNSVQKRFLLMDTLINLEKRSLHFQTDAFLHFDLL